MYKYNTIIQIYLWTIQKNHLIEEEVVLKLTTDWLTEWQKIFKPAQ